MHYFCQESPAKEGKKRGRAPSEDKKEVKKADGASPAKRGRGRPKGSTKKKGKTVSAKVCNWFSLYQFSLQDIHLYHVNNLIPVVCRRLILKFVGEGWVLIVSSLRCHVLPCRAHPICVKLVRHFVFNFGCQVASETCVFENLRTCLDIYLIYEKLINIY